MIEQAKGRIAERTGRKMGESFELLRSHARASRRRLTEVAADVVAGDVDIDALTAEEAWQGSPSTQG